MWKLFKLAASLVLITLVSSPLTAFAAKAPAVKATLKGSCADSGIYFEDSTCKVVLSAGLANKLRTVHVQLKNKKKKTWSTVRTLKLNSNGSLSYLIPADCSSPSKGCDGINNYRFLIVKSGSKGQIVTNATYVIFDYETAGEVNPPDPTPPDPTPPVPTPQNIPNIPSPRVGLSSDGMNFVITQNSWPSGTLIWVTWYKNGEVIPGANDSSLRLTKDLSNASIQVKVSAYLFGYNPAEVVTNIFSTTIYPLSSKSSVKQILVDGLSWYCSSIPTGVSSTSNWNLITFQSPYTLWASTFAGPVYLNISTVNSEIVEISSSTSLGTQALTAWGCPSTMQVLIR
jgi:hypothetical protein